MHGENLLVDDCRNWKAIEAIGEGLPQLDIVPPLAFVVEPVDPVDGGTFVISAENEEVLGILDFVRKEKADCFQRLLASVYIVAEKEIVGFWRKAAVFEQAQEVVILSMNITAYLHKDFVSQYSRFLPVNQLEKDCSLLRHTLMGASSSKSIG